MSDESGATSQSTAIMALLVALPLLYLFSIGPVVFVLEKNHATSSVQHSAGIFYAPVIWLRENTALRKPLDNYVEWWEKLAR